MSLQFAERIAPEVFDQAKRDAAAARQAAMRTLVDDLWRVMTSRPSPHIAKVAQRHVPC